MIWLSLAALVVALLPSRPIALECNAPKAGALSSLPHCVPLSDEAIFYWRFDDSRGKIQLGGHFKAAGWVGLGLSANGGKGAMQISRLPHRHALAYVFIPPWCVCMCRDERC